MTSQRMLPISTEEIMQDTTLGSVVGSVIGSVMGSLVGSLMGSLVGSLGMMGTMIVLMLFSPQVLVLTPVGRQVNVEQQMSAITKQQALMMVLAA